MSQSLYDYFASAGITAEGMEWQKKVILSKTPYPHQIADLNFLACFERSGVYSEPGTGKTLSIQGYGLYLVHFGNKIIYVMPPILIPQFKQSLEATYVGVEKYVTVFEFNLTPEKRGKILEKWDNEGYPDILLMSYRMFVTNYQALVDVGYSCVIVDEATAVKSPTSQVFMAVKSFVDDNSNGVVLVTGTPVDTNVEDCYGLISIVTPDAYSSVRNFEYKHMDKVLVSIAERAPFSQITGYKNLGLLHDNLFRQARRVLKSEVVDLPPRIITEHLIRLSPKHSKLYRKIVNERMLEIGDELIDLTTAQSLYQAIQRVLICPELFDDSKCDNTLLEMLDSIIESLSGRKVLVYAWFNASIDAIAERYKHLNPAVLNGKVTGDVREQNKQRFINDDSCKMLIANPKSGGVGVDGLQHVCSHVVYAEVCPYVGTFQQSIDRLHRNGQKSESVNIYLLVAKDTVAVKLRNNLCKKDAYQEDVVQDSRTILNDLLGVEGIVGSIDDVNYPHP
jgi:SNF2 family DNA or RNA helicase